MTQKTQSHQITKTSFMRRQRYIFSQMCTEKGKIPIQKCMCLFNHEMKNNNDSEEKCIGYFYNMNTKNVNENQVKTFPTLPPYNKTSHYSIQLLKALPKLTMRLLSCSERLSTLCVCCRWFRKVTDRGIIHSVVRRARLITIVIIYQTACKNSISSETL